MRCLSCNKALSDRESTYRFMESGHFVDLCDNCIQDLPEDLKISENTELSDEISNE